MDSRPTGLEQLYRHLDKQDDQVWSLDLDHLVCPYFPICDPIVNHEVVRIDATHLTSKFAQSLAPTIGTYLKQNAVIPANPP